MYRAKAWEGEKVINMIDKEQLNYGQGQSSTLITGRQKSFE